MSGCCVDRKNQGGQAVSDTPRTDQIEKLAYWFNDDMTPVCESRFVRSLERELNEAKELIKRLEVAAWKNYNNSHKTKEDKP